MIVDEGKTDESTTANEVTTNEPSMVPSQAGGLASWCISVLLVCILMTLLASSLLSFTNNSTE